MESPKATVKHMCRVCDEVGHYDLWETKFHCNERDVLLIEAFNAFSTLNNVNFSKHNPPDSTEIYLCEMCTESLTLAYSFWQQIKRSDEKFMKIPAPNAQPKETIEITHTEFPIDSNSLKYHAHSDKSIDSDDGKVLDEPVKKKFRKKKMTKLCDPIETPDIQLNVKNIALPHFVITNVDIDHDGAQDPIDIKDEFYGDGHTNPESHRKKIKTLKPTAVIPPDLDKINELLGLSPLDTNGDTQSIFKCSHCPKAFAAPHHLMIHMRKSHMCQYCLATFGKINDLYSHVKEMHKTFECLLCGKEFQSNGNLRQHMRKNHSIFLPAHISLLNVSDMNQQDSSSK